MDKWWYAASALRSGPTDEETLKRLLQDNTITAETLVWREGLDVWIPLGSENALAYLLKALPPPLPEPSPRLTKPQQHVEARSLDTEPRADFPKPDALPAYAVTESGCDVTAATAWRRWFARLFDVWIEVIVVLFLLFLASMLWSAPLAWIRTPAVTLFLALGLLPAALVLDTCIHTLFGNTPGKALLRVAVMTETHARPGWRQHLGRNLSMWCAGLALGLPLLSLFSMGYQARRLRQGRSATYDSDNFHVIQRRLGWTRRLVFAAAFATLLFLNTVLSIIADQVARTQPSGKPNQAQVLSQAPRNLEHVAQASLATVPSTLALPNNPLVSRCPEHFYGGGSPVIGNIKIIEAYDLCYQGAAVTYSPITYTPLWSAEHLTATKLEKTSALSFIPDAHEELRVPQSERASAVDFEVDGYSIVPLTPPTRLATALARIESSSFASIVPMKHEGLAKRWAELGKSVAERAHRGGDVYTISGTLFEGETLSQLNSRILVPTGFYVAFVDLSANNTGAYILANREGAKVKEISLPDLERRAGLILFPKLPANMYPEPSVSE